MPPDPPKMRKTCVQMRIVLLLQHEPAGASRFQPIFLEVPQS